MDDRERVSYFYRRCPLVASRVTDDVIVKEYAIPYFEAICSICKKKFLGFDRREVVANAQRCEARGRPEYDLRIQVGDVVRCKFYYRSSPDSLYPLGAVVTFYEFVQVLDIFYDAPTHLPKCSVRPLLPNRHRDLELYLKQVEFPERIPLGLPIDHTLCQS